MARFQTQAPFPALRPRRLRSQPALRAMVRETQLSPADLIWPIFVMYGDDSCEAVSSMPGVNRYTVDRLPALAKAKTALRPMPVAPPVIAYIPIAIYLLLPVGWSNN